MAQLVVNGAMLQCSMGAAPSNLIVIDPRVGSGNMPAANRLDSAPIVNIPPFGMCMSLSNPTVASATAAALGVLTPMPCVPSTAGPWMPASPTVMVRGMNALNSTSTCMCTFGGVITVVNPGQVTVNVP